MIKEIAEAKAMLSDGYSFKVKAGGLWYLERAKSKPQRVHRNVIRVLRQERREVSAALPAPNALNGGPLFSIQRNEKRGTPTSNPKVCVEYLVANGVVFAKKEESPFCDYFSIRVSKNDEKLASRLLFGSSKSEWERWAKSQEKKAARKRAAKKCAAKRRK